MSRARDPLRAVAAYGVTDTLCRLSVDRGGRQEERRAHARRQLVGLELEREPVYGDPILVLVVVR